MWERLASAGRPGIGRFAKCKERITALFGIEDAWLLSIVFIACMGSLIASLIAFITDIDRSLIAFKVELYGYEAPKEG